MGGGLATRDGTSPCRACALQQLASRLVPSRERREAAERTERGFRPEWTASRQRLPGSATRLPGGLAGGAAAWRSEVQPGLHCHVMAVLE